ncbi:MAG: hypothetical protein HQK50_02655 [Oligoflexia bacterium]|nr:hypothetical protein [Oligoflexia bacterium]MBF0364441.1 hypothetical protein [Oligoflexia bacterium]
MRIILKIFSHTKYNNSPLAHPEMIPGLAIDGPPYVTLSGDGEIIWAASSRQEEGGEELFEAFYYLGSDALILFPESLGDAYKNYCLRKSERVC